MKLNYALDRDDFLTFQLYTAAHSPQIKRTRRLTWLLIPALYYGLGLIYWKDFIFAIIIAVFATLWLIFYPFFQRKRYAKIYGRYLDENYKNRYGRPIELMFEKDYLFSKDFSGEGKLKVDKIEKIIEIPDYFFIKSIVGVSLILPKQKMKDVEVVAAFLKDLAQNNYFPYQTELTWQWK